MKPLKKKRIKVFSKIISLQNDVSINLFVESFSIIDRDYEKFFFEFMLYSNFTPYFVIGDTTVLTAKNNTGNILIKFRGKQL
jgi:hypothetical protein